MSIPSSAMMRDNPVMYLRLGESSGTSAVDATGLQTVTYVGTPTLGATGALSNDTNTAVTLNGTTQYLSAADSTSLDLGNGPLTLMGWIKPDPTHAGDDYIFSKGTNAYALRLKGTSLIEFVKDGVSSIVTSTSAVTNSVWSHVAATKTGSTSKLYINGVDVTGTVTDATLSDTSSALEMGRLNGGAGFFIGGFDEFAVYATALSADRILAIYNAMAGKFHPHTATTLTLSAA